MSVTRAEDLEVDLLHSSRVVKLQDFTARCAQSTEGEYPDISLRVTLSKGDPDYHWNDRISRFDLRWEGRAIAIEDRFWNDLQGLLIETFPDHVIAKVPDDQKWDLAAALEKLFQPRLVLSEDKGTVLIEWTIPQECDSRSTIRWIISKKGTVLRHRDTPFHEC